MTTNQSIKKGTVSIFFLALFFSLSTTFAQQTVQASDILKDIKAGKTVSYDNMTIVGDLDMTFMDEKMDDLPKKKNGGKMVEAILLKSKLKVKFNLQIVFFKIMFMLLS